MASITDTVFKPTTLNLVVTDEGLIYRQTVKHDYVGNLENFLSEQATKVPIFLPLFKDLFFFKAKDSLDHYLVYKLPSLTLNASWRLAASEASLPATMIPSGYRFRDQLEDTKSLILTSVWTPPADLQLYFIYEPLIAYLVLVDKALTFCGSLPLPNCWDSGQICLGDSTPAYQIGWKKRPIFEAANIFLKRLTETYWGGDLWTDARKIRASHLFQLNPVDQKFIVNPSFTDDPEFWKSNTFAASGDFEPALKAVASYQTEEIL